MIDATDWLIATAKQVAGIKGRAYRSWPEKEVKAPYLIVSLVNRTPTAHDADGSEVTVRMAYSLDVFARRESDADAITDELCAMLEPYHVTFSGHRVGYAEAADLHQVTTDLAFEIDKRGMTYRS